jgi:hypothetical protein
MLPRLTDGGGGGGRGDSLGNLGGNLHINPASIGRADGPENMVHGGRRQCTVHSRCTSFCKHRADNDIRKGGGSGGWWDLDQELGTNRARAVYPAGFIETTECFFFFRGIFWIFFKVTYETFRPL